jgi:hypothetical protein
MTASLIFREDVPLAVEFRGSGPGVMVLARTIAAPRTARNDLDYHPLEVRAVVPMAEL